MKTLVLLIFKLFSVYVELSPTAADTATVTLATNPAGATTGTVVTANAANAARMWDIQVSQIECFSAWRYSSEVTNNTIKPRNI